MRYYAGIGSRRTPPKVLKAMTAFARDMSQNNIHQWILRSGGADGADLAFEAGVCFNRKEIFLPWRGFNRNSSLLFDIPPLAFGISLEVYGSRLKYMKHPIKLLMARNVQQVLGANLDLPSEFVVCWTPDGAETHKERSKETGGTGQAISVASLNNIPVFNLQRAGRYEQLLAHVNLLNQLQYGE